MPQIKELLADPDEQSGEWLNKHLAKRHPHIGFATRGEHDADHRLHEERLDHYHQVSDR